MLTSSDCAGSVRPPGITATSMSRMVSGFDVLSCVTFMRSSKLAGFVRLSKQQHYQCLVGVNYIFSCTRYNVIIPWCSMQVVPLTRASKLSANLSSNSSENNGHALPIMQSTCIAIPSETIAVFLTRFNKIAIPNNKFQMAHGQGSHWLIESPTIFSSMCSPPLSNICQFYF